MPGSLGEYSNKAVSENLAMLNELFDPLMHCSMEDRVGVIQEYFVRYEDRVTLVTHLALLTANLLTRMSEDMPPCAYLHFLQLTLEEEIARRN